MSINNLTIGVILSKTLPYLASKGIPNPRLEADLMLAAVLNLTRVAIYSQWDRPLEPGEVQRYRELIVKRVQGWPMAYLVGKKSFLSWEFNVNPAVLIPRPETELLVEAVYERVKDYSHVRGMDVGTGSGVIAIALAKMLPVSTWLGVDISAAALEVARINAVDLGVADRVSFIQGDLVGPNVAASSLWDVIVSNPPYIPGNQIETLQREVRREPLLALDGGVDGLEIYRRLVPLAVSALKPGGWLAVEHGYDQKEVLLQMFQNEGLKCETLQDLAGIDRVVVGRKSGVPS